MWRNLPGRPSKSCTRSTGRIMEVTQEELEHKIMNLLLQGEHPALGILRQQYASAEVASREFTGVGFFTRYLIPDDVPLVQPTYIAGGLVELQLEELQYGAGSVLFARDGKLSMLEVYTNAGEPWPEHKTIKTLSLRVSPIERYRSNH